MNLEEMSLDDLKAGRPDLVEAIGKDAIAVVEAEVNKMAVELAESQRETGTGETETSVDNADIQRVAVLEDEMAGMRAQTVVAAAMQESDISESGAILVRRRFEGAKATDAGEFRKQVDAEIQAVGGHEKALMESMRLPGVPGLPESVDEDFDARAEIGDAWGVKLDTGGEK